VDLDVCSIHLFIFALQVDGPWTDKSQNHKPQSRYIMQEIYRGTAIVPAIIGDSKKTLVQDVSRPTQMGREYQQK
jgi:hypothetical protein